jgi:colicin import membrane protein
MVVSSKQKYFILSAALHLAILLILILSIDFAAPLVVVENTNKNDIISAVVLGDTIKSKILPQQIPSPTSQEKSDEPKPKPIQPVSIAKEVMVLKAVEKKKPSEIFGKDLLADLDKLKKQSEKKKKLAQQKLKSHFEKTLKAQAEKTMRQQLLNEEIKLKGQEAHDARGIINKYQALILQAISEHWIVPSQANKRLASLLLIRLAPNGTVLDVQVIKSSGNVALDNSARAAVFKASPLPVPADAKAFAAFKEFNLKAKPQDVLANP